MNFIEKAKEAFANRPVAPKLSKAKAAAAQKELEKSNPNRARINQKIESLKQALNK